LETSGIPTLQPTTAIPSHKPSPRPSHYPTPKPTSTAKPTRIPTYVQFDPTPQPTDDPTPLPTPEPTPRPTFKPTESPTYRAFFPTPLPTPAPTPGTLKPTPSPTDTPTYLPGNPTPEPTEYPTKFPTPDPTRKVFPNPTHNPTPAPSVNGQPVAPTPKPSTNYPTSSPTYRSLVITWRQFQNIQAPCMMAATFNTDTDYQRTFKEAIAATMSGVGYEDITINLVTTLKSSVSYSCVRRRQLQEEEGESRRRLLEFQAFNVPTAAPTLSSIFTSKSTQFLNDLSSEIEESRRYLEELYLMTDDTPTFAPTPVNASEPTNSPTLRPTRSPTRVPTYRPGAPTPAPTNSPTIKPTNKPTKAPTLSPTPGAEVETGIGISYNVTIPLERYDTSDAEALYTYLHSQFQTTPVPVKQVVLQEVPIAEKKTKKTYTKKPVAKPVETHDTVDLS
jgi:hypothetical protein